jgi:3-deoxy-D-manno-octulosonic-acid transferase
MLLLYSIAYSVGFIAMLPAFLLRRAKYASGLRERLGNYSEFRDDGRSVIWLHCVSVGETNAARPLVDALTERFPSHRVIVSTTTRTGHELAKKIFTDKADAVFYYPFDWKFSVRRALTHFSPSMVLLMETEIWPRFIAEADKIGCSVAIVNGRLSKRSFERYARLRPLFLPTLQKLDAALMQSEKGARRVEALGVDKSKIQVTGNLKFDMTDQNDESGLTAELKRRFRLDGARPLVVAASTHGPEEEMIVAAMDGILPHHARLLIAPRHPERFDIVAEMLKKTSYRVARRSSAESENDRACDVVLLDSIGELRAVYPLAELVFVGGSLIQHGGQSILEPAAAARAMVTGPYTDNFSEAVATFLANDALVQMDRESAESGPVPKLHAIIDGLLHDENRRSTLGENALRVMAANRGAADKTVGRLAQLLNMR